MYVVNTWVMKGGHGKDNVQSMNVEGSLDAVKKSQQTKIF